jgi:hypothetical protein
MEVDRAIALVKEESSDAQIVSVAADLGSANGCAVLVKAVPSMTSWSTMSEFMGLGTFSERRTASGSAFSILI